MRRLAASATADTLERTGAQLTAKDRERSLTTVAQFAMDANADARHSGRRCLYMLSSFGSPGELERQIDRLPDQSNARRLRDTVAQLRTSRGVGAPPKGYRQNSSHRHMSIGGGSSTSVVRAGVDGGDGGEASAYQDNSRLCVVGKGSPDHPSPPSYSTTGSKHHSHSSAHVRRKASHVQPSELETLPGLLTAMAASDFRSRHDAIRQLAQLMEHHSHLVSPADSVRFWDVFVPRLSDANSKVLVAALHACPSLILQLKVQQRMSMQHHKLNIIVIN